MRLLIPLLAASALLFSAVPSYAQGAATVTCKDGTTSKAGKGACSHHGGVNRSATQAQPSAPSASPPPAAPETGSKATGASPAPQAPAPAPAPRTKSTGGSAATGSSKAANTDPTGAIAQCKDGTYSHSKKHSGACSHHGGVAKWLDQG